MAVCLCFLFLVCITSAVYPPPVYYKIIAEQRRVALEDALAENEKVIKKPCLIVVLINLSLQLHDENKVHKSRVLELESDLI